MGISKVDYYGTTLMDLTKDTVTPDTLVEGATAHDAQGRAITGTAKIPTKLSELENDVGFTTESGGATIELKRW